MHTLELGSWVSVTFRSAGSFSTPASASAVKAEAIKGFEVSLNWREGELMLTYLIGGKKIVVLIGGSTRGFGGGEMNEWEWKRSEALNFRNVGVVAELQSSIVLAHSNNQLCSPARNRGSTCLQDGILSKIVLNETGYFATKVNKMTPSQYLGWQKRIQILEIKKKSSFSS